METELEKNSCTITFYSNFSSPGHVVKEVLTVALFILHNAAN